MSRRLSMERKRLESRVRRGDPLWPPQLAIAVTIGLNFALADKVTVGPRWLLPGLEAVLLLALVKVAPSRASSHETSRRNFALVVVGLATLAYLASLVLLVHYLVAGGHAGGHRLIESGALLWVTNVLLFSVWYWEIDSGGPVARHIHEFPLIDFQFPQMQDKHVPGVPENWRPGYADYLYTSLTNATAFSPTDVMPLTQSAKLVMAIQSVSALATIGLVIARAVNILG